MVEIKKILVAIDLSPLSIKALEWAENLKEKYNSELVVFYELEDVFSLIKASLGFSLPIKPHFKEEEVKKAEEKIKTLLRNLDKVKYIIEAEGTLVKRLPKIVEAEKPDLVVIFEDLEDIVDELNTQILIIK